MKVKDKIINIGIEHIHPHPDNPRKDLGDITELAESIKKNGVMQNLTVIPKEGEEGEYITIIGHRRCAAAKLAAVTELPCRIVEEMDYKEQVSTMLEENMQRNDLTIYEQAQGFQMMLDLGDTEEQIAEKTGFSRTTIRHRLNIAKLNQEELRKKEQDEAFQLTLKDLYALEQLEDVEERNKILREATNSQVLQSRVKQRKEELKREENAKELIKELEEMGVSKAPEDYQYSMYSGKWETVKYISLDEIPPKIPFKKEVEGCFYYKSFRNIQVLRKKGQ